MKLEKKLFTQSLMWRLLLFFSVLAFMVWCVTAVLSWQAGARHSQKFFDTQQILFANTLGALELNPQIRKLQDIETLAENTQKKVRVDDEALAYAIFSLEGELLLSDNEHGQYFPFTTQKGFVDMEVDDEAWRTVWVASLDGKRIIAVGQEYEYRQDLVFEMLERQLVPWFLALPLLLVGILWLLFKELRPLRSMAKQLHMRKPEDTSPLGEECVSLEVRPLVNALNALFLRMGELLQRERSFVSNAAHELRTPLAGLKVQAEVMEMCADDPVAREHALQKILQGIARCTHLVEQLLLLSRLEASSDTAIKNDEVRKEIPLMENLVQRACEEIQPAAQEKNIHITFQAISLPALAPSYVSLWEIALRNILDNAVLYTPKDGEVHIKLTKESLCIENTTKHFTSEELQHLGERFFRPAGQNEKGSGLGLAIVRHIVHLHGLKMHMENSMLQKQKDTSDSIALVEGVRLSIHF